MSNTEQKISEILDSFRSSTIIIHAKGSVRGAGEDTRAFEAIKQQAEQAILQLITEAKQETALSIAPINMPDSGLGAPGSIFWEMGFKAAGAIVRQESGTILTGELRKEIK